LLIKHILIQHFMDSVFLELINEIVCSYSDDENLRTVSDFWDGIEPAMEDDNRTAFLLGSVYGQCLFLYNSYYDDSRDPENRKKFQHLLLKIVKGMRDNFKEAK
jgi:hypothetical protein